MPDRHLVLVRDCGSDNPWAPILGLLNPFLHRAPCPNLSLPALPTPVRIPSVIADGVCVPVTGSNQLSSLHFCAAWSYEQLRVPDPLSPTRPDVSPGTFHRWLWNKDTKDTDTSAQSRHTLTLLTFICIWIHKKQFRYSFKYFSQVSTCWDYTQIYNLPHL